MKLVKQFVFATVALLALSGLAISQDCPENDVHDTPNVEGTGTGTGGKTGVYGIDVDTRSGGSYPGASQDTTTGTDTSQGMGGITGGRSGSNEFGIHGEGAGGIMGTYSSSGR